MNGLTKAQKEAIREDTVRILAVHEATGRGRGKNRIRRRAVEMDDILLGASLRNLHIFVSLTELREILQQMNREGLILFDQRRDERARLAFSNMRLTSLGRDYRASLSQVTRKK